MQRSESMAPQRNTAPLTTPERADHEVIADVQRVFALQRQHRWTMAQTSVKERIQRLERLRRAILDRRDQLAEAVHQDFRKHPVEFEWTEIQPVMLELKDTIEHLDEWLAPKPVKTPMILAGTQSEIRYEPRGVVLILSPWNYPFQLLINPLIAAIASGNCAILRPSEKTPHVGEAVRQLISATFDEREVALFTGGIPVADALLDLPFDHFFFTGSTRVGKKVMMKAAEHLATVTLELGGKSPAIVDGTADIRSTAERIAWGKYVNAGQTCVAPDYVLVDASVKDAFLTELKNAITRAYGKDEEARRCSADLCRLVDHGAFLRVKTLLEATVEGGAKVEIGGVIDPEDRYIAPTVLSNVSPDAPIMTEEIFGPVLPVLTVRSLDEAIERIRAGDKPLALYLFSRDDDAVERVLKGTTSGGALINNTLLHLGNGNLPFGGVGGSGQGSYHGEAGIRAFSHERAVMRQGRPSMMKHVLYPPYTARTKKVVSLIGKLFG